MSDSEQSEEPEVPEQMPSIEAGIPHLMAVAIQLNEMFKHLKSAGFTQEEAIQLSGVVLSSGVLYRYSEFQFEDSDLEDEESSELDEDGGDFI
jgi:hypothetical protein